MESLHKINVMSYNVFGMPCCDCGNYRTERISELARQIKEEFCTYKEKGSLDVILLQELFQKSNHESMRSIITEDTGETKLYMTSYENFNPKGCIGCIGPILSCWSDVKLSSGLAMISRHPILEEEFHPFTNAGSCWDFEKFACKGIARMRIQPFTHTQNKILLWMFII